MFIHKASEEFDPSEHFDTVPLYQGALFRRWQERYGRNVVSLVADNGDNKVRAFAQCVEYILPKIGSIWVAALAPLGSFDSGSSEEVFYKELRSLCVEIEPKTIAVRIQRKPEHSHIRMTQAERVGGSFVQPYIEEAVPLEEDIEDIIRNFSGNTRRIVRRYERGEIEGVRFHIEKTDFKKHFNEVYALFKQLAQRKKFGMHEQKYYELLFEELNTHPKNGTLILGYVDGEEKPVSFVLVIHTKGEAYHLYSASSSTGYEHNTPTLAHYIAIRDSKKHDAKRYNLGGTASASPRSAGDLSTFKKKFGGKRIKHPQSVDIVVSRWRYTLFRFFRLKMISGIRRLIVRLYKTVKVELEAG